jgi:hypothetical protein
MAIKSTDDTEVLEIHSAGGCLVFLGLPFLVFGLLVDAGIVAALLGFNARPATVFEMFLLPVLAITFTFMGAILVFGRSGHVLDRRNGTICSWRRFLWWHSVAESALSDFDSLALARYRNRSRHGPDWLYRVQLVSGDQRHDNLELGYQFHEKMARKNTALLAEFLTLPVVEIDRSPS